MSICGFTSKLRGIVACIAVLTVFGLLSSSALADYQQAKGQFDGLDLDSKISITLGLIGTGDFDGLFYYGFTKRLYKAVNAFKAREGLSTDGILDKSEIKLLSSKANPFLGSLGLKFYSHPTFISKLFVPRSAFDTETTTQHGFAFERDDSNLSLSFDAYSYSEKSFSDLYSSTTRVNSQRQVDYKLNRDTFFVVNGVNKGRNFYTWMSATSKGSTGFTLSWSPAWATVGKKISILLANTYISESKTSDPNNVSPPDDQQSSINNEPRVELPSSGTGTGFKVTDDGHVLTNFHVAGRCQKILLLKPGEISIAAQLVSADETNDLALLKAERSLGGTTAKFNAGSQPKAGSDIVVYGFPLAGTLSTSGNVVTGNITALAGMGNDSRLFQISAPVQPGNSGGPVIDRYGNVVAVIVSKLNVLAMSKITGDISQNVNFAIKGNVATNFMEGVGAKFQTDSSLTPLDTPTIGEKAQGFTYLVECQN